jgi:hypothetical protein
MEKFIVFLLSYRCSLNLIECLLHIADTGLHSTVLEIFKHGIQRSSELIFLGLLQLHVSLIYCWIINLDKYDVMIIVLGFSSESSENLNSFHGFNIEFSFKTCVQ